jgi:RNA polymerase sigma factor (sigma-70 family)
MATGQLTGVVRHLRRVVLLHDGGGMTDGQLLECFLESREEAAFEALLRRHGPMVHGVCRRVLSNVHDADDAFQATFLVLIRKAASIVPREMVGNWLYGVAYRTSLKAKAMTARRYRKERPLRDLPGRETRDEEVWRDLEPLLDRELHRLPDKYRMPIVLCDLEGKSRKETAHQLGLPEGTISSRLARGRRMLARRLARHGPVFSAGMLAALLSRNVAAAGVPRSLVDTTVQAAVGLAAGQTKAASLVSAKVAALMEGVLKAMLITKLKIATVVMLTAGLAGVSAGKLMPRALADKPAQAQQSAVKEGKKKGASLPSGDILGFKTKGHPFALERTFPGINGALLLTDEQSQKIAAARAETIETEAVKTATMTLKSNPNATNAEKEAAQKVIQEARAKLEEKVAGILTAEQKVLVERINTAAQELQQSVLEEYQAEFTAAKGNAEQTEEVRKKLLEKLRTDFPQKLNGILSPEQKTAFEKAAAAQKAAEEAGKNTKKPGKE